MHHFLNNSVYGNNPLLWPWWIYLIIAIELIACAFVGLLLYRIVGPSRLERHFRLAERRASVLAERDLRHLEDIYWNVHRAAEHQRALRINRDRVLVHFPTEAVGQ